MTPGAKLGSYEVIRQIATGGTVELYLARTAGREGFEKLVVLERIRPQYATNASFVDIFLDEARRAATLQHPNVAQVYDIGCDGGEYFVAMEYVHGEGLDHIAAASEEQGVPISLDAALTLVAGLCAGLHYAHERVGADGRPLHIVHRDVSPSNVLVGYDGAVKLVDFGIARAASHCGTTHGGLEGKIAYMSPEQCRAKAPLDRRSDLYSVGAILYELTTGRPTFTGETEYQILDQIVNADVPPPSAVVPDYPPQLERIVLRALARDPDRRYATGLEMQADVEGFAHETRLRISPLVLARLMGTLFPTRLEQWDEAKTQGQFFLEQHVVQTLIESGKAEPDEPETLAPVDAPAIAEHVAELRIPSADDETTALGSAYVDHGDTTIGEPPLPPEIVAESPGELTAPPTGLSAGEIDAPSAQHGGPLDPPAAQPVRRSAPELFGAEPNVEISSPPEPARPAPYPVVTELMSEVPGSLATSTGTFGVLPPPRVGAPADVTERVRIAPKRAPSPTTFVRGSTRTPLYVMLGCVVVAGAVAAVIALRPGTPPRAPAEDAVPSANEAPPPATSSAATPTRAPEPPPAAKHVETEQVATEREVEPRDARAEAKPAETNKRKSRKTRAQLEKATTPRAQPTVQKAEPKAN